jgi:hypothetical protein
MAVFVWMGAVVALWIGQAADRPAYLTEGDRIEQQFREYRDRLERFFGSLREVVTQQMPQLLPELRDRPPETAVYGYQILPVIIPDLPTPSEPVSTFSYSWPITAGYVNGETIKLSHAEEALAGATKASDAESQQRLPGLVREYRSLVQNQRTIDQYVQYNRFWQASIAADRQRFDRLTAIYDSIASSQQGAAAEAIIEAVGKPEPPAFIQVRKEGNNRTVLRVPLYTDIEDDDFVAKAKSIIEDIWKATDGSMSYAVELDLRRVQNMGPRPGDHIDLDAHVGKFPKQGGVLTTGAQSTHGVAGRYIALGPGDLFPRTLAHEFGHVLGFRDGYIRGYRNLGAGGFEILELTSVFDDIMSAPRQGVVQAAHFKLLLEQLK